MCYTRQSRVYACVAYFHFHQYKPTSYTYKYAQVTHSCNNRRQDNNEVTGKQPVTVKGSIILTNDYYMSIHFKLLKWVPLITTMATHFTTFPSPPLDNIRVMVIVWRLRGNIIRTALCWIVWYNVRSPQHTYASSYRLNRLGLSHWDSYAVHRGGCL